MGPVIHKSWDILRAKLDKLEPLAIKRRVGNKTVVFVIDEPEYDPSIPILQTRELERWLKNDYKLELSDSDDDGGDDDDDATRGQSAKQPDYLDDNSGFISDLDIDEDVPPSINLDTNHDLNHQEGSINLSEPSDNENNNQEELDGAKEDADESKIQEAICQGEIDRFVIAEEDDIYRCLAEDDVEEETQFSKNKKKIRIDQPGGQKPPPPAQKQQPKKATPLAPIRHPTINSQQPEQPRQSNGVDCNGHTRAASNNQNSSSSDPGQSNAENEAAKLPDWTEIGKRLQKNSFHEVYRELIHFKSELANELPRSVLKEAIDRSIVEDETNSLIDFLKIYFEIDKGEDTEFWNKIILRVKRKINNHSQVKCFKVKTNPEWVFANYQRAMQSISDHARTIGHCLITPVPLANMTFLLDPFDRYNLLEKKNMCDKKPDSLTIKVEQSNMRGENLNRERKIEAARTPDGRPIFKVSVTRTTLRNQTTLQPSLRSRL